MEIFDNRNIHGIKRDKKEKDNIPGEEVEHETYRIQ